MCAGKGGRGVRGGQAHLRRGATDLGAGACRLSMQSPSVGTQAHPKPKAPPTPTFQIVQRECRQRVCTRQNVCQDRKEKVQPPQKSRCLSSPAVCKGREGGPHKPMESKALAGGRNTSILVSSGERKASRNVLGAFRPLGSLFGRGKRRREGHTQTRKDMGRGFCVVGGVRFCDKKQKGNHARDGGHR